MPLSNGVESCFLPVAARGDGQKTCDKAVFSLHTKQYGFCLKLFCLETI